MAENGFKTEAQSRMVVRNVKARTRKGINNNHGDTPQMNAWSISRLSPLIRRLYSDTPIRTNRIDPPGSSYDPDTIYQVNILDIIILPSWI